MITSFSLFHENKLVWIGKKHSNLSALTFSAFHIDWLDIWRPTSHYSEFTSSCLLVRMMCSIDPQMKLCSPKSMVLLEPWIQIQCFSWHILLVSTIDDFATWSFLFWPHHFSFLSNGKIVNFGVYRSDNSVIDLHSRLRDINRRNASKHMFESF